MTSLNVTKIVATYPANFGQKRVLFTTNEHGPDYVISGFFAEPPSPGQTLEGDLTDKPGVDKNGNQVTYHNFALPKNPRPAQPSQASQYISRNVDATLAGVQRIIPKVDGISEKLDMLIRRLENKGVLDKINEGPSVLRPAQMNTARVETNEEPPLSAFSDDEFPQF